MNLELAPIEMSEQNRLHFTIIAFVEGAYTAAALLQQISFH